MCSGMQGVKKAMYMNHLLSELFLSSLRKILKDYIMCDLFIFMPLIGIAYLLISVMTLLYVRTESGIQKCVCWSATS